MHQDGDHVCGVRAGRDVWCWGRNDTGELGINPATLYSSEPVHAMQLDAKEIAVSPGMSCAASVFEDLYCWGSGWTGPTEVPNSSELNAVVHWSEIGTSMGLKDGRIVEWDPATAVTFSRVSSAADWTKLAQGDAHTCGIRGAQLYCWGSNGSGQLGLGADELRNAQPAPRIVSNTAHWLDVAASDTGTCGLHEDKTLWCWGDPFSRNDPYYSGHIILVPQQIQGQWEEIAMGASHVCAIGADGTLWCWGENLYGQGGFGDYWTNDLQPVELPD
jgi:alpha-tubulin suppressor-like RCC1 family protein